MHSTNSDFVHIYNYTPSRCQIDWVANVLLCARHIGVNPGVWDCDPRFWAGASWGIAEGRGGREMVISQKQAEVGGNGKLCLRNLDNFRVRPNDLKKVIRNHLNAF